MSFLMALNHKSVAGISLVLAMLACNLPDIAQPTVVGDQTVTVTAATLQEPTRNGTAVTPTATASPTPSGSAALEKRARSVEHLSYPVGHRFPRRALPAVRRWLVARV